MLRREYRRLATVRVHSTVASPGRHNLPALLRGLGADNELIEAALFADADVAGIGVAERAIVPVRSAQGSQVADAADDAWNGGDTLGGQDDDVPRRAEVHVGRGFEGIGDETVVRRGHGGVIDDSQAITADHGVDGLEVRAVGLYDLDVLEFKFANGTGDLVGDVALSGITDTKNP